MIKKKTKKKTGKKPMPTAMGKTKKAKAPTKKAGPVKGSRGPTKKPVPKKKKQPTVYGMTSQDIINKTKKKKIKA